MRPRVARLAALLLFAPIIGHAQQPTPVPVPPPKCPIAQPDPNAIADIDLMPALAVVPTWSSDPAGLLPSNQPVTLRVSFPAPFPADKPPEFTIAGRLTTDSSVKFGADPKPGTKEPVAKLYKVQSWHPTDDRKGGELVVEGVEDGLLDAFWPTRLTVTVAACTGTTLQIGKANNIVSQRWPAIIIALVVTVLFYVFGALSLKTDIMPKRRRLNPLWLAIDGTGRASLSQMQVIYFTVIVLFLVIYILLRTGILASLSSTVLLLLGIAGVGSVAGQLASNNTQRISYENWAWLKHKGWTAPNGMTVDEPRWNDLFATNDMFDPYRFQMVSFSFVIGIALLMIGLNGLAHFTVPESLLGIIGLSQAAYVAGKIAAPASFGALDAKITELRKAQDEFLAATANTWVSPPAAPATALGTAKVAAQDKYLKFQALVVQAKEMFDDLFKEKGSAPNLEPDP